MMEGVSPCVVLSSFQWNGGRAIVSFMTIDVRLRPKPHSITSHVIAAQRAIHDYFDRAAGLLMQPIATASTTAEVEQCKPR